MKLKKATRIYHENKQEVEKLTCKVLDPAENNTLYLNIEKRFINLTAWYK